MSIWDDLYIINEAKSAKQLVAEMSQEIKMKPKKDTSSDTAEFNDNPDNELNNKNSANKELSDDINDEINDLEDDLEDGEDDFSDIETELPNDDGISDEDIDNLDMEDELTNSDSMLDDEELNDGEIEETEEDKTRVIHLLTCVNQLYDSAFNFSKRVSYLDDFPSENLNKLIRLLDFYREYKFDSAKPEDIEKVVKSSTKILKSLAQRYRNLMNKNVRDK